MAEDNKIAGEVVDLGSLIEYQDGSVVSRVIVKDKGGTITLFAFGADQALSEHTAPFEALVQVLDGEVDVTINGQSNKVCAGQSIVMPANEPHALTAVTAFKMLLTMIKS